MTTRRTAAVAALTAVAASTAVAALTAGPAFAATPDGAASRYHVNGCMKGTTVGSTKLVYDFATEITGRRACVYMSYQVLPLGGLWPTSTQYRWAR